MSLLLASLAGSAGAVCRYLVSGWVQRSSTSGLPVGTLVVNVLGAFGLGLVVGAGSVESLTTIVIAGFFGGFTTFSTWMVETVRLGLAARRGMVNIVASVVVGVAAAAVGYTLVG